MKITLNKNEKILAVKCEKISMVGWENKPIVVIIGDYVTGKFREVYIQKVTERTKAMFYLFDINHSCQEQLINDVQYNMVKVEK